MARNAENPLVGIIMGSDSDLPHVRGAGRSLERFDIAHEYRIKSAHRTPEEMGEYARTARRRGLKVIIAAAGGSAHLPGMVASETSLPVLGIAVESSPDPLSAAFGSMLRMPSGIPLATMGKSSESSPAAAENAGLEAVRILATSDPELAERYEAYMEDLRTGVIEKDNKLNNSDVDEYIAQMRASKK